MVALTHDAIALLNAIASNANFGGSIKQRDIDMSTSNPYMHGPGGLFNIPGVQQDVFSLRLQPEGLLGRLPAVPSMYAAPEFLYLTGFKAGVGTDPDGVCDDPREAGPIMTCTQRAQFGRQSLQTRPLEINRVGLLTNRAEPLDFRIINDPIVPALGRMVMPGNVPESTARAIGSEVLMRWLEVGNEFVETLLPQLYTGTPANNSAGGGTKEYMGLDMLIGTNKVDAETGTPCPGLRSQLVDMNFAEITGAGGGQTYIDMFASLFYRLRHVAARQKMGRVRWVAVMREGAFRALTRVWPCAYYTGFCNVSSNSQAAVNVDGRDMAGLRDDMYNQKYLIIDGERLDVIIDDSIEEGDATGSSIDGLDNGCYSSDIYIIPMTVRDNYNVTFMQYLDYRQGAMIGAREGRYNEDTFWTDSGIWLFTKKPPQMWCVQWAVKTEQRLIMLTPHLAARILNVKYCYEHEQDSLSSQYFYTGGGVENRPARALYSDYYVNTPSSNY